MTSENAPTEFIVVFPCEGEGCDNDSELIVQWAGPSRGPNLHLCQNCLWKGAVMPDAT